ncbi:thiamine biosynthesis protein ThiF [Tsukamurella conjunctivitidis]|uniref:Thiamine biosynthesis protein ThiF n=1 Tax=Tsukamurella conjunctivitidis TaxID=2592068 RepID=A0A5C5RRI0_9ACTN|nr:ThiF family adenylyltransferase [Tsukamurella conjunctivitidis]TWS25647.1 thiamine biosynthesis protein ThiF [Tsukamurella conjunctivitidis]
MEILVPGPEADARVTELRAAGFDLVDGWSAGGPELTALAALPQPPAGCPEAWDPGDEERVEELSRYVVCKWRRTIARLPRSDVYHLLRTARNRHLISDADQASWSASLVGVVGLSVGSSAATACQLTGVRRFRIGDGDELGITNLNRIVDSAFNVGTAKTESLRRRLLECDPYASVDTFPQGISESDIDSFLCGDSGDEQLSVLIEEIDGIHMKVALRRRARELRIPVVMATDLGDDVVLDVERFDIDEHTPILGDRLASFSDDQLRDREPSTAVALAGALLADVVTPRMLEVAGEVGRSLSSWPQLGSTAMHSGAVAAHAARLICTGHELATGRYLLRSEFTTTHN